MASFPFFPLTSFPARSSCLSSVSFTTKNSLSLKAGVAEAVKMSKILYSCQSPKHYQVNKTVLTSCIFLWSFTEHRTLWHRRSLGVALPSNDGFTAVSITGYQLSVKSIEGIFSHSLSRFSSWNTSRLQTFAGTPHNRSNLPELIVFSLILMIDFEYFAGEWKGLWESKTVQKDENLERFYLFSGL